MTSSSPRGETRRLPPLLRMTMLEFLLTAGLLFIVVSAGRWVSAPDSPVSELLSGWPRSLFMGLLFGAIIAAVIGPSMRRRTAGHLNPSVSVGLWLLGEFPGKAVLPFVAAQLCGSLAGVALAGLAWGKVAAEAPVGYATIAPAPDWNTGAVFAAEAGTTAAIMLIVATLVARPRLKRYLPVAVGGSVAAVIIFLGPLSGGSINPARQFGPALVSGQTAYLWIYLLAPIVGSCVAGGLAAAVSAARSIAFQSGAGASTAAGGSRRCPTQAVASMGIAMIYSSTTGNGPEHAAEATA